MKNSKAVVDIITAVLIVIISMGLAATAYTWGIPLIQKSQDTAVIERIISYFDQNNVNSLPSRIEFIANNGGEHTFTLDSDGFWRLYPCPKDELPSNRCNPSPDDKVDDTNSMEFTFFSKVSNVATYDAENKLIGFVSLTPGAKCPPEVGILGTDRPSVVCAKAVPSHDGFEITYKVWFRELKETEARAFKIDLTKHASGVYSTTDKILKISRQDTYQVSAGGKTLIIPEIKILLE